MEASPKSSIARGSGTTVESHELQRETPTNLRDIGMSTGASHVAVMVRGWCHQRAVTAGSSGRSHPRTGMIARQKNQRMGPEVKHLGLRQPPPLPIFLVAICSFSRPVFLTRGLSTVALLRLSYLPVCLVSCFLDLDSRHRSGIRGICLWFFRARAREEATSSDRRSRVHPDSNVQ